MAALLVGLALGCGSTRDLAPLCVPFYTSLDEPSGFQEIEYPASEGTLWALLFSRDGEFQAGTTARILWKMTDGRGDIRLVAIHEDGVTRIRPSEGPVSRSMRSDWIHEEQEWGSEFIFPKAGCWRILVSRYLVDTDRPVTGEIEIQIGP
ncbi:MAG TPA: hypothetical protein VIV15_12360 [Anaerolineales bacterium]